MPRTSSVLVAAIVLVSGLGVTSCSQNRWCEHDATDTVVSDSFCKKNTPGYEWEYGSDSKKKKRKKKQKH